MFVTFFSNKNHKYRFDYSITFLIFSFLLKKKLYKEIWARYYVAQILKSDDAICYRVSPNYAELLIARRKTSSTTTLREK